MARKASGSKPRARRTARKGLHGGLVDAMVDAGAIQCGTCGNYVAPTHGPMTCGGTWGAWEQRPEVGSWVPGPMPIPVVADDGCADPRQADLAREVA